MNVKKLFKENLKGGERRALTDVLRAFKNNGLKAIITGSTVYKNIAGHIISGKEGKRYTFRDLDLVVIGDKKQYVKACSELNQRAEMLGKRQYCFTHGLYDCFAYGSAIFDIVLTNEETPEDYLSRINKYGVRAIRLI